MAWLYGPYHVLRPAIPGSNLICRPSPCFPAPGPPPSGGGLAASLAFYFSLFFFFFAPSTPARFQLSSRVHAEKVLCSLRYYILNSPKQTADCYTRPECNTMLYESGPRSLCISIRVCVCVCVCVSRYRIIGSPRCISSRIVNALCFCLIYVVPGSLIIISTVPGLPFACHHATTQTPPAESRCTREKISTDLGNPNTSPSLVCEYHSSCSS